YSQPDPRYPPPATRHLLVSGIVRGDVVRRPLRRVKAWGGSMPPLRFGSRHSRPLLDIVADLLANEPLDLARGYPNHALADLHDSQPARPYQFLDLRSPTSEDFAYVL
ncbi:MAG TPA: hypothetical protein PLV39_13415, partial [Fimbriimonadaceae bacterium]|nr:hypothetical protein [Fimbriimonadaceae bacterium]